MDEMKKTAGLDKINPDSPDFEPEALMDACMDAATEEALAWCNLPDDSFITMGLQQVISRRAEALYERAFGDGAVSSVKRGDFSVSYQSEADADDAFHKSLLPYRRMRF